MARDVTRPSIDSSRDAPPSFLLLLDLISILFVSLRLSRDFHVIALSQRGVTEECQYRRPLTLLCAAIAHL